MHMYTHYNPRLQHLAHAVYITNALSSLLYHTIIDLFLLSRSTLSLPCLQFFNSMNANSYVMENNKSSAVGGERSELPLLEILIGKIWLKSLLS